MKKIGIIGSCLSNLTAIQLCKNYNYERVFNIAHNRSDAFIGNFIKKNRKQLPIQELIEKLDVKPEHYHQTKQILMNQYINSTGKHELPDVTPAFNLDKNDLDIIILDNFMDIASLLVYFSGCENVCSPFFINRNFINNTSLHYNEFLTAEESCRNWLDIIDYLRIRFPNSKIVFMSFHYSTLIDKPMHLQRARDFNILMSSKIKEKDCLFIPSISVTPGLTKGIQDWAHYDDSIYSGLAGMIYLSTNSTISSNPSNAFIIKEPDEEYNKQLKLIN